MRLYKDWGRGCYVVSDSVNNIPITKSFHGRTKDEAISEFRAYIRYVLDPSYEPSEVVDETFSS